MQKSLLFILAAAHCLFIIDVIELGEEQRYLESEGHNIIEMLLISDSINSDIMEYVHNKKYSFKYDDTLIYQSGDFFHFELIYSISLIYEPNKLLYFIQDVILGAKL